MAVNLERRRWDLLVVVTAEPYVTDTLTTALRLARSVLARGRTVRFWACGYNTALTQLSVGDAKPVNVRDPAERYPSTAELVRRMVREHDGRFAWLVCTICAAERGVGRHIDEVRLRSAPRFAATVASADRVVYIGGS